MTRLARVVLPCYPHHVTQRGVRSMKIFQDDDRPYKNKTFYEKAEILTGRTPLPQKPGPKSTEKE